MEMSLVMDWDGSWGIGGWLAMSLMMVVFWGGLIALVVFLVRGVDRSGQSPMMPPPDRDADQLLAERYARGEIDEDEFTRRREVLRAGAKKP
jgi:putative membrane protein